MRDASRRSEEPSALSLVPRRRWQLQPGSATSKRPPGDHMRPPK